jgi:hypothetical protein
MYAIVKDHGDGEYYRDNVYVPIHSNNNHPDHPTHDMLTTSTTTNNINNHDNDNDPLEMFNPLEFSNMNSIQREAYRTRVLTNVAKSFEMPVDVLLSTNTATNNNNNNNITTNHGGILKHREVSQHHR